MTIALGLALVLFGLLAALAATHFKGLRYFDRPALGRNPFFDPALGALMWIFLATGLLVIGVASRPVLIAATAALVILWGYRRVIRSVPFQARLLKSDFEALRRQQPALPEDRVLYELACRRHPQWGEELIEQMVRDYPTIDAFAPMVARMERGFRGFKGGSRGLG
jgi:hypothetical protein